MSGPYHSGRYSKILTAQRNRLNAPLFIMNKQSIAHKSLLMASLGFTPETRKGLPDYSSPARLALEVEEFTLAKRGDFYIG